MPAAVPESDGPWFDATLGFAVSGMLLTVLG